MTEKLIWLAMQVRVTERTKVMYEDAGICYVYLCYGIHWLLNLVTGPKDYPAAVLIRGLEDFTGPGRLTKEWVSMVVLMRNL